MLWHWANSSSSTRQLKLPPSTTNQTLTGPSFSVIMGRHLQSSPNTPPAGNLTPDSEGMTVTTGSREKCWHVKWRFLAVNPVYSGTGQKSCPVYSAILPPRPNLHHSEHMLDGVSIRTITTSHSTGLAHPISHSFASSRSRLATFPSLSSGLFGNQHVHRWNRPILLSIKTPRQPHHIMDPHQKHDRISHARRTSTTTRHRPSLETMPKSLGQTRSSGILTRSIPPTTRCVQSKSPCTIAVDQGNKTAARLMTPWTLSRGPIRPFRTPGSSKTPINHFIAVLCCPGMAENSGTSN